MDFSAIFRRAYVITIDNPVLWLFGIFLTSGFNAHWFVFSEQIQFAVQNPESMAREIIKSPKDVVLIILSLIATGIISLVISNWAKILLFLHAAGILKLKRVMPGWRRATDAVNSSIDPHDPTVLGLQKKLILESRRYLGPVIGVSALTGALTVAGSVILFYPAGYLLRMNENQGIVLLLAILVFIPLLFLISFQNIFATLFIILYQRGFKSSLNLATDLVLAKWQHIAAFAIILMIIYGLGLSAAGGIVFVSKAAIAGGFGFASHVNSSAAFMLARVEWILVSLLVVTWMALLNVFFNVSLLLLFSELVKAQPAEFLAGAELKNPVPLH